MTLPLPQQLFSLKGRRAVVTGANRGIGLAIARGLAAAGAEVALAARDGKALAVAREEVSADGATAHAIAMDVTDVGQIRAGMDKAAALMGGIDILVNNAGMEQVCPSLDVEEALWDKIMNTNLRGAFFAAQAAARHMVKSGKGGAILNLASLTSERGIPTAVPYGASKTGLVGITRALAVEWAPHAIRVNALEPGYFRTALTEPFYQNRDWQQAMLANIPMRRFGEMNDLVGASIFLCCDAAQYVTGVCLPVDGGTLASL